MAVISLHADPDNCPVVTGCASDAFQSLLVCNNPLPCEEHEYPSFNQKVF